MVGWPDLFPFLVTVTRVHLVLHIPVLEMLQEEVKECWAEFL